MATREYLIAVISALLGGGLLTGVAGIWKAKQEAKKVPGDLSSLSISSAERALLMLKILLDEKEEDLIQLRKERDEERERHKVESREKDKRIADLEADIKHLALLFNEVSAKLAKVLLLAREANNGEE